MKARTATGSVILAMLLAILVLPGTPGATSPAFRLGQSTAPTGQPSILNDSAVTSASKLHLTVAQRLTLESQIAEALNATPNAKRVSLNEIEWTKEGVRSVLTLPIPGLIVALAADCPSLWVCVYDGADFVYPRQAFFNCGNATISSTIGVSSWHNNQSNNTASWLLSSGGTSLQNTRALSKVSYVGAPSNDLARTIHVC